MNKPKFRVWDEKEKKMIYNTYSVLVSQNGKAYNFELTGKPHHQTESGKLHLVSHYITMLDSRS